LDARGERLKAELRMIVATTDVRIFGNIGSTSRWIWVPYFPCNIYILTIAIATLLLPFTPITLCTFDPGPVVAIDDAKDGARKNKVYISHFRSFLLPRRLLSNSKLLRARHHSVIL
jgi:hypothetical protein